MLRKALIVSAVLVPMCHAAPSFAGMKQDLANCTAAKGRGSAAACTRVMNSGRLRRSQYYIGYFNRGSAYRNAGDFRKALSDFQKVVEKKPRFARGYHARALANEDLGKRKKALSDLGQAIKLNKKDWSAYYSRASIRRADGAYEAALQDLKTAKDLKPDETKIGLLRALILADKGAVTVARAEINKIIANGTANASSYYARAEVAFAEERMEAAEDDVDRVLKLKPKFGAAHLLKGRILAARGDKTGAKKHYRKARSAPVPFLESRSVVRTAQLRLDELEGRKGKTSSPKPVASASDSDDRKTTAEVAYERGMGSGECRLYLPTTGVTVSTPCKE